MSVYTAVYRSFTLRNQSPQRLHSNPPSLTDRSRHLACNIARSSLSAHQTRDKNIVKQQFHINGSRHGAGKYVRVHTWRKPETNNTTKLIWPFTQSTIIPASNIGIATGVTGSRILTLLSFTRGTSRITSARTSCCW